MTRGLVLGVALLLVVSFGVTVVAHSTAADGATAGSAATSGPAASGSPGAVATPGVAYSPHPGDLVIHEIAPGGATTMDPATAYDTVSYEPILNTYETLLSYNKSTTSSFVPILSTCVPGTSGCAIDYNLGSVAGSDLVAPATSGPLAGEPVYWTFPVDPHAMFYDPSTGNSWHVWPSDVMFSVARTLNYADLPFVGSQNGWILAQALLPEGNASYDVNASAGQGVHAPFNNTPYHILSSMLINDSTYCPAAALAASGCITFVANGSGQDWPEFLQFVANGLGASVVPCGVFTANGANVPGFAQVNTPPNGDGSCLLPGGALNTADTSFQSFLSNPATGSNDTYWDSVQLRALNAPNVDPWPMENLVGTGPYWASVSLVSGYTLYANPAYVQPSGCSGAMPYTYVGYCDPAPGSYVGQVNVTYDPDDTNSVNGFATGTIDEGEILPSNLCPLLCPVNQQQEFQITVAHSLSNDFFAFNTNWSTATFAADFPSATPPNVSADFFTGLSARQFFVEAYPYLNVQNQLLSIGGVPYGFEACGPIPQGMGDYYPANITCPSGNPDTNASHVGGAAWWWAQGTNPSSAYYDPELAACTVATPCVLPIMGEIGASSLNAAIQQWISQIYSLSGGAIQPYELDPTPSTPLVTSGTGGAFDGMPIWPLGWATSYPDPTDPVGAYVASDGPFPDINSVEDLFNTTNTSANQTLCGHFGGSPADLAYWAYHAAQYPTQCEGIAYDAALVAMTQAAPLSDSPQRVLLYNEMSQIVNGLGLYTWFEQQNTVREVAPWIDLGSVNTNAMVGGQGVQPFFHWAFVPPNTVTFLEKKLPVGTTWGVVAHGVSVNNTTVMKGTSASTGTVSFHVPNGTFYFNITSPVGYGVAKIAGPNKPNQTSALVPGGSVTFKVQFGPLEPYTFYQNLTIGHGHLHMYPGAPWQILVNTSLPHGGDPTTYHLSGTNYKLGPLYLPKGGHYRFDVVGFPSIYKAHPGHGKFGMPGHPVLKKIKFKLHGTPVKFKEKGLPEPFAWNITLVNASGAGAAWFMADCGGFGCTFESVNGSAVHAKLPAGTYGWVAASNITGLSASPPTGLLTVHYPSTRILVVITWS